MRVGVRVGFGVVIETWVRVGVVVVVGVGSVSVWGSGLVSCVES